MTQAGRSGDTHALKGRVAVVTGGARGIGLTIATAYLRAGARLAILDRDRDTLARADADLGVTASGGLALGVDVRFEDEVEGAFDEVVSRFGQVDVLVNNAALLSSFIQAAAAERPRFWEVDPGRWRELWDVNVTGLWLCARRAAREMIRRTAGSIINVTTTAHIMTSDAHVPYGPSKAAVEAFTRAGALQLKPYGVRMNALLPGALVTPRDTESSRYLSPEAIVPAALYLASEESARVTGASIIAEEYLREQGILPPGSPRAD